jgi:hypothetical protein
LYGLFFNINLRVPDPLIGVWLWPNKWRRKEVFSVCWPRLVGTLRQRGGKNTLFIQTHKNLARYIASISSFFSHFEAENREKAVQCLFEVCWEQNDFAGCYSALSP